MKTRLSFCSIIMFVSFLKIITPSPVNATIRIMPLGDSITQGVDSGASPDTSGHYIAYRKTLHDLLVGAGYDVDFVGSLNDGFDVFTDSQHEGHGGWTADEIRDNIYNWLVSNPADVILLHIGTNDINEPQAPADIVTEVSQLLDQIDQYEADYDVKITVILALIINRQDYLCSNPSTTTTYNDDLNVMAQGRIASGDRIEVVDMECGAGIDYHLHSAGGDMNNTLHPFSTGYDKMAQVWFAALEDVLISLPNPDIRANGSDDPINLNSGETLSITIELDPGDYPGVQADWWCAADTPFGWYYFNYGTKTWLPGFQVSYQGPLEEVSPPLEVLNMSDLPAGSYTFYFGVDGDRNGNLGEPLYYDSVDVSITSP
jgi:lysophospholipase L1-like esterase